LKPEQVSGFNKTIRGLKNDFNRKKGPPKK